MQKFFFFTYKTVEYSFKIILKKTIESPAVKYAVHIL